MNDGVDQKAYRERNLQPPAPTPIPSLIPAVRSYGTGYGIYAAATILLGSWLLFRTIRKLRNNPASKRDPYTIAVLLGLCWALPIRLVYFFPIQHPAFPIMSVGFLVLIPLVLGYLTIVFLPASEPVTWKQTILLPWTSACTAMVTAGLLMIEGLICLIMAAPIWMLLASIGGMIGRAARKAPPTALNVATFLLLISPPVVSGLESFRPGPISIETVINEAVIEASPAQVWREIRSVRTIEPRELPGSFVFVMGFPKPLDAEISGDGIGAVRHARFEGGVVFTETVTDWEPERVLGFTIRANTEQIPPTTLDEHITIGGEYFDTLNGRYEIIPEGERRVRLKLSSQHRLSTRFNPYAALWSRYIMSSIQSNILTVIEKRAENAG